MRVSTVGLYEDFLHGLVTVTGDSNRQHMMLMLCGWWSDTTMIIRAT